MERETSGPFCKRQMLCTCFLRWGCRCHHSAWQSRSMHIKGWLCTPPACRMKIDAFIWSASLQAVWYHPASGPGYQPSEYNLPDLWHTHLMPLQIDQSASSPSDSVLLPLLIAVRILLPIQEGGYWISLRPISCVYSPRGFSFDLHRGRRFPPV